MVLNKLILFSILIDSLIFFYIDKQHLFHNYRSDGALLQKTVIIKNNTALNKSVIIKVHLKTVMTQLI